MKKYRLKKWYPSLPEDWTTGMEVETNRSLIYSVYRPVLFQTDKAIDRKEVENNPEFWEEVEKRKRLLIKSADGYGISPGDYYYFVHDDFNINTYKASDIITAPRSRCFVKQENAERYTYDHKPVFSRKQIFNAIDEICCSEERTGLSYREGASFELALNQFMKKLEL